MSGVPLVCEWCGAAFVTTTSQYNRQNKIGHPVRFCSRPCSSRARSAERTTPHPNTPEGRAAKAEYDRARRQRLADKLREDKRAAYLRDHAERLRKQAEMRADPAYRQKMRAYQYEHARRPEWRAHKKKYDRKYRAERDYGEWAEAYVTMLELREAALAAARTDSELRARKGTLNKSQQRKRNASSETQRRRAQGHPVERARRCSQRVAGPGECGLDVNVRAGDPADREGSAVGVLAGRGGPALGTGRLREAPREPQADEVAGSIVADVGGAADGGTAMTLPVVTPRIKQENE